MIFCLFTGAGSKVGFSFYNEFRQLHVYPLLHKILFSVISVDHILGGILTVYHVLSV